jgi:hypothetical protein
MLAYSQVSGEGAVRDGGCFGTGRWTQLEECCLLCEVTKLGALSSRVSIEEDG